jgi:hypothetical protein
MFSKHCCSDRKTAAPGDSASFEYNTASREQTSAHSYSTACPGEHNAAHVQHTVDPGLPSCHAHCCSRLNTANPSGAVLLKGYTQRTPCIISLLLLCILLLPWQALSCFRLQHTRSCAPIIGKVKCCLRWTQCISRGAYCCSYWVQCFARQATAASDLQGPHMAASFSHNASRLLPISLLMFRSPLPPPEK